ncbi:MAG: glutamine amidotransferase [Gammaproteobacteria bacterium]|nr:MAG: glutamine amidotransferase [Gammaproteobacteria bacterium]
MKSFLILQARPETEVADDEYAAILAKGGLSANETRRIRLDAEPIPADLDLTDFSGVIIGGGPTCFSDPPEKQSPLDRQIESAALSIMPRVVEADIPFLGCCYGVGLLGTHLGAEVAKGRYAEPVGTSFCRLTDDGRNDPLLEGVDAAFTAFVGHKESLQELPQDCTHLVSSETCPFQMIRYGRNVYATQFHPEADAAGFEMRIDIYRHSGYFPPEAADDLVAMCRAADVTMPERVLANFVRRYRR